MKNKIIKCFAKGTVLVLGLCLISPASYGQDLEKRGGNNKCGYVKKGSKEGFTGWKFVIKPNFTCSSKEFDEETNLAVVQSISNNQWGVINKKGEVVIPMEYQEGLAIKNGKVVAKKGGKWGLLDTEGKTLLPFDYDYMDAASSDNTTVLLVRKGEKPQGKYGFIDFTGKILVPIEYDEARFIPLSTSTGSKHYNLKKGGQWGLYGLDEGKFITDIKYDAEVWYTSMNKPLTYKGKIGNDEYEISETGVEKYLGTGTPKSSSATSNKSSGSTSAAKKECHLKCRACGKTAVVELCSRKPGGYCDVLTQKAASGGGGRKGHEWREQ